MVVRLFKKYESNMLLQRHFVPGCITTVIIPCVLPQQYCFGAHASTPSRSLPVL